MFLSVFIAAFLLQKPDTLLAPAVLVAEKEPLEASDILPYRTRLNRRELQGIESPKELSALIPNLHIPDYGSSMTSSIYFRGMGSRMENPVMGLYIDDIPILDKNAYDFDFLDVRSVLVLRGPQSFLYGRNALMGVMSVTTLSPELWQGTKFSLSYGNGNSIRVQGAWARKNLSIAASYRHADGFYTNTYTGKLCDPYNGASLRLRYSHKTGSLRMDHILSLSWTDQGGYPYTQVGKDEVHYNDPSGYRRLYLTYGLRLQKTFEKYELKNVASVQLLADRMTMDQDFTAQSLFTLQQRQRQWAVTEELTLLPSRKNDQWQRRSGFFAFVKKNRMNAPVTFKEDGIRTLILDNANAHIPDYLGKLSFDESTFPIDSRFDILTFNAALYHESVFRLDAWEIVAALRADTELSRMDYASNALVNFRLIPAMPESYPCRTVYEGVARNPSFQLLPKLSVLRSFEMGKWRAMVSATWAEGYRAGGFNTQLFSDILQNKMMNELMALCGIHLEGGSTSTSAQNTVYKPEYSDNFELGAQASWKSGDFSLNAQADAFYILVRNQQITVFPEGLNTGRMMKNVGRSRSAGAEAALDLAWKDLRLQASYGLSDARFLRYHDGNNDYSGKRIPYSPLHTLAVQASYQLGKFSFRARLNGRGDIYWNEDNSRRQPFYLTLDSQIQYESGAFRIFLRGRNLTGQRVPVFWFKSVGREFYQLSHPATVLAGIEINL